MQSFWIYLSSLATSPLFSGASFVLAVLGVILAIYFYRKGRRYKELSYAIQSDTLVEDLSDRFPKLKISFAGEDISALTVSRIAVWNSGTVSIRGADIPKNDPLSIDLSKDSKVLSTGIISRTKNANAFAITHDTHENELFLVFDYADPGDGIVASLIHSGSRRDVGLKGSVIGVHRLNRRTAIFNLRGQSRRHRFLPGGLYFSLFSGGFGAAFIALAVWAHTLPAKILIAVFGGIYVLFGLLFPLFEREKLPKGLQSLDKEEQDIAPNKANSVDAKSRAAD